ncbi:MAG TPA: coenzyme F420 hydrogenase, partial [Sphingomicrobium sp.]|nr:coenzyme F420 hydrogenase [Sphingomicrobium sp.]
VYRTRAAISAWSHRVAWLAQKVSLPAVYTRWARTSLRVYQALAWSQGRLGRLFDRLLGQPAK